MLYAYGLGGKVFPCGKCGMGYGDCEKGWKGLLKGWEFALGRNWKEIPCQQQNLGSGYFIGLVGTF